MEIKTYKYAVIQLNTRSGHISYAKRTSEKGFKWVNNPDEKTEYLKPEAEAIVKGYTAFFKRVSPNYYTEFCISILRIDN